MSWKFALRIAAPALALIVVTSCVNSNSPSSTGSSQITIGAPADASGNIDPFGALVPTYQQVYSSTLFGSGSVKITGLTFPRTSVQTPSTSNIITQATYTFSLSTTAQQVDALDAANLSNNVGSDNQTVFSGPLSGTPSSLVITTTSFTYNPTAGNLLLQITQAGGTCCGGIFFDARNGTAGGAFSRAGAATGVSGTPLSGTAGYGLVTTFTLSN